MRHYFINREHDSSEFFTFEEKFLSHNYKINSCADIFSKNKIDDGSKILLQTVVNYAPKLTGTVLDVGCGYGIITMVLRKELGLIVDACDVNATAVALTQENIEQNAFDPTFFNVFESNLYSNVTKKYNNIVTNPPIKVGKQTLFGVVTGAYDVLNNDGNIFLVIRKDAGMESLKKCMLETFGNCQILERSKGYYILHSIKK